MFTKKNTFTVQKNIIKNYPSLNGFEIMRLRDFLDEYLYEIHKQYLFYNMKKRNYKTNYEISQNYATKFEMQLMQKELEILKLEMRDFKLNFNSQIAKMEEANDSILELITDIRLTLAERRND